MGDPQRLRRPPSASWHIDVAPDQSGDVREQRLTVYGFWPRLGFVPLDTAPLKMVVLTAAALVSHQLVELSDARTPKRSASVSAHPLVFQLG